MQIFIVGSGKLATELLKNLALEPTSGIVPWQGTPATSAPAIVVHAGSGRELEQVAEFCERSGSVLVELATGSALLRRTLRCPVVLCPNTNILMLKFITMLHRAGPMFAGSRITVTESHQAGKTSVAGTAVVIAEALALDAEDVVSVRDPREQEVALRIPQKHLARHAVHVVSIEDGACTISLEARVYGSSPYADGVSRIIAAVQKYPIDCRAHTIAEFIDRGLV